MREIFSADPIDPVIACGPRSDGELPPRACYEHLPILCMAASVLFFGSVIALAFWEREERFAQQQALVAIRVHLSGRRVGEECRGMGRMRSKTLPSPWLLRARDPYEFEACLALRRYYDLEDCMNEMLPGGSGASVQLGASGRVIEVFTD
jgi:hypothetical protein